MRVKGKIFGIQFILIFLFVGYCNAQSSILSEMAVSKGEQIEILMIFDNPYGAEYNHTRKLLEDRFGWSITTTSLFETIDACTITLPSFDVDYTIDNLPSLSNFDILTIMPGEVHENLMASQEVLDLVRDAVQRGLIVSAWCKGVRVLAAADVINGTMMTGQWEYKSEYQAAGGIYYEFSPPIIDGNIVTCQSSTEYRVEMCCALAEAVGVLENDPPIITDTLVTQIYQNNYSIMANVSDITGVFSVQAKLFLLSSLGFRVSNSPAYTVMLNETSTSGAYVSTIEITDGQYSIDIDAVDIYYNLETLRNVSIIGEPNETSLTSLSFLVVPIATFLLVLITYSIRKKG
ncbi:MAG: DJ-1/PfpI family protein [Candidatus Heimdallarchaeota archaeon]